MFQAEDPFESILVVSLEAPGLRVEEATSLWKHGSKKARQFYFLWGLGS